MRCCFYVDVWLILMRAAAFEWWHKSRAILSPTSVCPCCGVAERGFFSSVVCVCVHHIHKFAYQWNKIRVVRRHEKAIYCEIYARGEESLPLKRRFLLDGRAHTKRKCWNVHFDLFARAQAAWLIKCGLLYGKMDFYMRECSPWMSEAFRKANCDSHQVQAQETDLFCNFSFI